MNSNVLTSSETTSSNPLPIKTVTEVSWGLKSVVKPNGWEAPEVFTRNLPKPTTSKSVQVCPAAVDFDARYFVIKCPTDLTLLLSSDQNGSTSLQLNKEKSSTQNGSVLDSMVSLTDPNNWRHKDRPVVEILTPYVFHSKDVVYLNLTPAFMDYRSTPLPGITLNARFPINTQSNQIAWAFEWHDIQKEFKFKQGEPWFYVYFESTDPSRKVRLVKNDNLGP